MDGCSTPRRPPHQTAAHMDATHHPQRGHRRTIFRTSGNSVSLGIRKARPQATRPRTSASDPRSPFLFSPLVPRGCSVEAAKTGLSPASRTESFRFTSLIAGKRFHAGMIRLLTTLHQDIHQEHHPAAPHACELSPRQCPWRLPRLSPHRPRTRFLLQVTHPHFRNPHLRRWIILQIFRLLA